MPDWYAVTYRHPTGWEETKVVDPIEYEREQHRRYWAIHNEEGEETPADPSDEELLELRLESWKDDEEVIRIEKLGPTFRRRVSPAGLLRWKGKQYRLDHRTGTRTDVYLRQIDNEYLWVYTHEVPDDDYFIGVATLVTPR